MGTRIRDIDFISGLSAEIQKCSDGCIAALPAIEAFINEKLLLFQEIENELQNRLQDCQTRLENRNNLLTICKARMEYYENGLRKAPNCSSEESDTIVAKAALDAARKNLNSMENFNREISDLLIAYYERRKNYEKANTDFAKNCIAYLNEIRKYFNQYVNLNKEYGPTE